MTATESGSVFPEYPEFEPRWEQRCPGRFRFEIEELRRTGVTPLPDQDAVRVGQLAITFDWPLDADTILTLKAVYPDTFPRLRPQVFLVAGLESWPRHHINPLAGNLCLLGRESRQWMSKWTLRKLLDEQLGDAIRGGGEEDPQGEPAEVWWNTAGPPGAYCLIDSAWDPKNVRQGTLQLHYAVGKVKEEVPIVRAVVTEVCDESGTVLFKWEGPLPADVTAAKKSLSIRWVGLDEPFLPSRDIPKQIRVLQQTHPWLQHIKSQSVGVGLKIQLFGVVHPSEVGFHHTGVGWVFFQLSGKTRAFNDARGKQGRLPLRVTTLPVYRAGIEDIGHRVPAVELLRKKRILVVGAGAIGAPVVLELARNGCGVLHLIEYDVVEPGNTVRWPLGASAWGRPKAEVLVDFLRREYPATTVEPHPRCLGQAGLSDVDGDDDVLDPVLGDVDLVIDASASHGVTWTLGDRCREAGVPLISLSATPSLQGGVVVRHSGSGGCPICLEYAWHNRELVPPPGRDSEEGLTQPPGCAERTFVGAGYDLQELSLQAVRLAVETLSGDDTGDSLVQVLSFVDEGDQPCLPRWQVDSLPLHPDCGCTA